MMENYPDYQSASPRTRIDTDLVGGFPKGAIVQVNFTGIYVRPEQLDGKRRKKEGLATMTGDRRVLDVLQVGRGH